MVTEFQRLHAGYSRYFRRINRAFVFAALLAPAMARAQVMDTTIIGNGTPGPYGLGNRFVDPASIVLTDPDSVLGPALPFAYVPEANALLFSAPIDSGARFNARFLPRFAGIARTFSLYEPVYMKADDSLQPSADTGRRAAAFSAAEDLDVSGYKSVGIAAGSSGRSTIEQAMDVSIFGDVAHDTRLEAHLSDQGTSLDEDTREISDIDMIYATLSNPRWSATVGDQYLRWPDRMMLSGDKKIKGIAATARPGPWSATLFGALSRGKMAVQTFNGRAGLQGPYRLTGNGENQIITVIGGTTRLSLNGRMLKEGDNADYTVDYDAGAISFAVRCPIHDRDIIRAEYEYTTFDYQRLMTGAETDFAPADSHVSVRGALWLESDNAEAPIDLELTAADRDSLSAAGDRPWMKTMGRPVPWSRADSAALYDALYIRGRDSLGRDRFVWAGTGNFPSDKQLYSVTFHRVADGQGDYMPETTFCPQPGVCYDAYRFAGSGGNFSAKNEFPAPQRTTVGEIAAAYAPAPWLSASTDIAGQEHDRNLLSARDDAGNTGAAAYSTISIGKRRSETRSAWAGATHRIVTQGFTQDVLSAAERKSAWNDTVLAPGMGRRQWWESYAGATVWKGAATEFSYGQVWRGDSLATDRISNATNARIFDRLSLSYAGALFRNHAAGLADRTRRDGLSARLDMGKAALSMGAADEWWYGTGMPGRGHAAGSFAFDWLPLSFHESVDASQHRRGNGGILSAADTGWSLEWTQSFDHNLLPGWRLAASSTHYRLVTHDPGHREISTLANLINDLASKSGLTLRQEYSITQELASSVVQEPHYVGVNGHYALDTTGTGDRYVPKIGGDWEVREREVYDPSSDKRIRKTVFGLNWKFKPDIKGLYGVLADLAWDGAGRIEEHLLRPDSLTWRAWLPGWYALDSAARDSAVRFADLHYRQSVDWKPAAYPAWHAALSTQPQLRFVRDYEERGAEWTAALDYSPHAWFFGIEGRGLHLRHTGFDAYELTDRSAALTQRYEIIKGLSAYLRETAGAARKAPVIDRTGRYAAVKPGLSWRPVAGGFGEASYTLSWYDAANTADYRLAQGNPAGLSNIIDVFVDVRLSAHFSLSGSYRGEMSRPVDSKEYRPGMHTMTMEMRAYL